MSLESTIVALKAVATFTPEFPRAHAVSEAQDAISALVNRYHQLSEYPIYLHFLKCTGGAHIHNRDFSLGLYGFGGVVVTSFDEGQFLDSDRYFRFGEVLYFAGSEPNYAFAFDFQAKSDVVVMSHIETSDYGFCADSFIALLSGFATRKYPVIE